MFGRKKTPGTEIELHRDSVPVVQRSGSLASSEAEYARFALGLPEDGPAPIGKVRWFSAIFDAEWHILALGELRTEAWVMIDGMPTMPCTMETDVIRSGEARWVATYAVGENNAAALVCVGDRFNLPSMAKADSLHFDNNLHLPVW